jgi:hypothetical protein
VQSRIEDVVFKAEQLYCDFNKSLGHVLKLEKWLTENLPMPPKPRRPRAFSENETAPSLTESVNSPISSSSSYPIQLEDFDIETEEYHSQSYETVPTNMIKRSLSYTDLGPSSGEMSPKEITFDNRFY